MIEKNWFNLAQKKCDAGRDGRDDSDRRKRTRISGNGPRAERAPTPVSELKRFIAVMLTCRIAEAQIRDMVQKVPEEMVCR